MTVFFSIRQTSASGTKLLLDPPNIVDGASTAGSNITLTLAVTDVADLFGYELKTYYNNTVLSATQLTRPEGNFLEPRINQGNQFIPKWETKNDFNATHGRIWLSLTLLSSETARSGSGPLARITFQILNTGDTAITMEETKLADKSGNAITHELQNSYFSNNAPPASPQPLHDVSVVNVISASSQAYIGDVLEVTVTVWNKGDTNESINIILYYNNSFAATKQINTLRAGAEHTLIFYWNTSSVIEGNYTLKALAVLIPYEANTEDNTKSSNTTTITSRPDSGGFYINWTDWLLVLLLVLSVALLILWFPFKRNKKKHFDQSTQSE